MEWLRCPSLALLDSLLRLRSLFSDRPADVELKVLSEKIFV